MLASIDILAALELVAFLYFMRHIKLRPIESACENLFMESSREVAEIVPKVACGY